MGKAIAITAKGIISVEHTEASLQRKFKKGDMVKTKCICVSMKNHERCVVFQKKFGNPLSYCNHCKFCLKVGIVEDTEEAGSNWKGEPKYGLRFENGEWLG